MRFGEEPEIPGVKDRVHLGCFPIDARDHRLKPGDVSVPIAGYRDTPGPHDEWAGVAHRDSVVSRSGFSLFGLMILTCESSGMPFESGRRFAAVVSNFRGLCPDL